MPTASAREGPERLTCDFDVGLAGEDGGTRRPPLSPA